MYCESELCVYNKDLSCGRDEVDLDTRGICCDYTEISVPAEFLEAIKQRHFKRQEEMRKKSGLEE